MNQPLSGFDAREEESMISIKAGNFPLVTSKSSQCFGAEFHVDLMEMRARGEEEGDAGRSGDG